VTIERYEHHGAIVAVRSDLKGRHWEHCLCARCARFGYGPVGAKCARAEELYAFCAHNDMVTPVWECPAFEEKP
jgi:hypothetical protein